MPYNKNPYHHATLLIACALLGGCTSLNTSHSAFRVPDPRAAQAPAAHTAPSASPTVATASVPVTDKYASGYLHFILDGGWGHYYGWQLQILSARTNKGFKPIRSSPMEAGEHLRVELWPDHYHVRVLLLGKTEYDGLVEIKAGQSTVIDVGIYALWNTIKVLDEERAKQAADSATLTSLANIHETFEPLPVTLIPGIKGLYEGPRENNSPAGKGRLTLHKGGDRIAVIEEAIAQEDGKLTGEPIFDDGRRIDNYDIGSGDVPPGAITTYKDGREFQGQYENLAPKKGTMNYPDGRRWIGQFEQDMPQGVGTLGMVDGSVIEDVPGMDPSTFDGSYNCVSSTGNKSDCHYFEGERIASGAEYKSLMQERTAEQSKALSAALAAYEQQATASRTDAPSSAAASTPATPSNEIGCTSLNGRFTTRDGLSKMRLDGGGRGNLQQETTGGTVKYFFEVNFSYSGTPDRIQLRYEEAVYKDASGRVLQRVPIPSDTVPCSFDGRTLTFSGVQYIKQ